MKEPFTLLLCILCVPLLFPAEVLANKSAVSIAAPANAEKGAEVTVEITVTHKGNSFFHYTDWVKVDVDGKTVARWDFTASNRPEDATFTRQVKMKAVKTMEVVAEANCNIHGSAGPSRATISVDD